MEKFEKLTSTAVPLPMENVDTDQIIPARFLKLTTMEGFGENLFRDWRYDTQGQEKPDFVLNNPIYSGSILVAGRNFGCGSSREHAAWALAQYGFRAVVSSAFADIFKNNALNNGVVTVEVFPEFLDLIFQAIEKDSQAEFTVDLEKERLTIESTGEQAKFDINPFKRECLLQGMDELDYLLAAHPAIERFEKEQVIY